MYLVIDFERGRQAAGLVTKGAAKAVVSAAEGGGFEVLKKAVAAFKLRTRRPDGIVVHVGHEGRDVTWSTVRAAVAAGNALAFALGVPVAAVSQAPAEGEDAYDFCRARLSGVAEGEWAKAAYNGEPNITVSPRS